MDNFLSRLLRRGTDRFSLNLTVRMNLDLMNSHKEGGMALLLLRESIVGNGATWKNHPAAFVNFYYESESGEIVYFGVEPHIPSYILDAFKRKEYLKGGFRIAFFVKEQTQLIVGSFVKPLNDFAKKNLEETVTIYNARNAPE